MVPSLAFISIHYARRIGSGNGLRGRQSAVCSLSEEEKPRVGFRRDTESSKPRATFRKATEPASAPTPNERIMTDIRDTMERLGVMDTPKEHSPRRIADISDVNPLSAFGGALGGALISGALWLLLRFLLEAYITHPLETDFYVVQRISAIVRTAVVGLLALGSGISGVTSLGLFLLGSRRTLDSARKAFSSRIEEGS